MANFNASSDDVAVLQGDGHGGFTKAAGSPFPANGNPRPLVVGDFNGDGPPDLAVVNSFQGVVTILDNTTREGQEGPPSSPEPIAPTLPPVTYPIVPTRAKILASHDDRRRGAAGGSWHPRSSFARSGARIAAPVPARQAGDAGAARTEEPLSVSARVDPGEHA